MPGHRPPPSIVRQNQIDGVPISHVHVIHYIIVTYMFSVTATRVLD